MLSGVLTADSDVDWQLGREVLDEAAKAVAVGVTTEQLDQIVHEASVISHSTDWLHSSSFQSAYVAVSYCNFCYYFSCCEVLWWVCLSVCPPGYLRNHTRDLYDFVHIAYVRARSSSGMLTIGRIAYRRKGGDGSAQCGRSAIYDCLVLVLVVDIAFRAVVANSVSSRNGLNALIITLRDLPCKQSHGPAKPFHYAFLVINPQNRHCGVFWPYKREEWLKIGGFPNGRTTYWGRIPHHPPELMPMFFTVVGLSRIFHNCFCTATVVLLDYFLIMICLSITNSYRQERLVNVAHVLRKQLKTLLSIFLSNYFDHLQVISLFTAHVLSETGNRATKVSLITDGIE